FDSAFDSSLVSIDHGHDLGLLRPLQDELHQLVRARTIPYHPDRDLTVRRALGSLSRRQCGARPNKVPPCHQINDNTNAGGTGYNLGEIFSYLGPNSPADAGYGSQ